MKRFLLFSIAALILAVHTASAQLAAPYNQAKTGSVGYGNTLCLSNAMGITFLDTCYPLYAPPAGSYSVAFVNSASARKTDDFSTLDCSKNNDGGGSPTAVTYTMPPSLNTSLTGSISGTTLTTSTGTGVAAGALVLDAAGKVLANTYITAGSGTSWTVNNSQTVTSEPMTIVLFPPGHGVTIKNFSVSQTAPAICTVTATTSGIVGPAGVVGNVPSAPGACSGTVVPIVLLPGGEVTLQADTAGCYRASGFIPGAWFQFANNVTSLVWSGLSGYFNYNVDCLGLAPATANGYGALQLAYN